MKQQINKVWILSIKWTTEDAEDEYLTAFDSEEKAYAEFKKAVKTCKELDCSEMFGEDGFILKGYELEEGKGFFYVYEEGWAASNFEEIRIYELDVQ